ncbi:dicarboxylic amino acid permease [Ascoidea rubescens DSM 1968]|uniref:Dicarboxylic amino acid permease n=1 Tax=Ascoidea rubescens DSM 1968 TaxID=1344418 RepID=A0A1D2VBY3_9ASCO|nr:dicarboxylic amino acid permease [Ascoidea rubescens DSM 1968]ODV58993.1 dicarboxylic amino acid permease [Ascoidea rubescens DSM 1968]
MNFDHDSDPKYHQNVDLNRRNSFNSYYRTDFDNNSISDLDRRSSNSLNHPQKAPSIISITNNVSTVGNSRSESDDNRDTRNNRDNRSIDTTSTASTLYRQVSYELHQVTSKQPLAITEGHKLVHTLKYYDLASVTFSGSIGSGIMITSATALRNGGPGSMLICFLIMTFCCYTVLCALCEMATYIPLPDAFSGYGTRYVDPAFGFATGYAYFFKYLVLAPSQMSAASAAIQYWVHRDTINPAVWISILLVLDVSSNYLGVNHYATVMRAFSIIKVVILFGMIIFSFTLAMGGGPNHDRTGFRYWRDPGAFASYKTLSGDSGRFAGFLATLLPCIYTLIGLEVYGIALGETASPMRRNIHKAHKLIFSIIPPFYCTLALLLGMIISHDDPNLIKSLTTSSNNAASSAFVIAIKNAGIPILPHIMNACILIFVFSASNTELYIAIRALYGLSVSGMAPTIFSKTNQRGVPIYSLAFCSTFALLGYMNAGTSSKIIFGYFVNVVTVFGLTTWISILISHLKFTNAVKAQGIERESEMYFVAPFAPYASYVTLTIVIILILIKNYTVFLDYAKYKTFDYKTFISGYIGIPIFFGLYFCYKFYHKTEIIRSEEVDLFFYKDVIDAEEEAYFRKQKSEE